LIHFYKRKRIFIGWYSIAANGDLMS